MIFKKYLTNQSTDQELGNNEKLFLPSTIIDRSSQAYDKTK